MLFWTTALQRGPATTRPHEHTNTRVHEHTSMRRLRFLPWGLLAILILLGVRLLAERFAHTAISDQLALEIGGAILLLALIVGLLRPGRREAPLDRRAPARPRDDASTLAPSHARTLARESVVEEPAVPEAVAVEAAPPPSFLERLRNRLDKTKRALLSPLLALTGRRVDEDLLEEVESILIQADVGVETTMALVEEVRQSAESRHVETAEGLVPLFRELMRARLKHREAHWTNHPEKPLVLLIVGVNGTGKTTSIGKIAKWLRSEGKSVMLVAADTFRAAAVEQLEIWAQRTGSEFTAQSSGADPGSVCYDALVKAQRHGSDVVLIDTAGRLHTKTNLMEELKKVVRVIKKVIPGAPHETLLVLDATTGQNAVQQAKVFHEAVDLTGLVMTKLDGTAKGGIILSIGDTLDVPIALIGVGEGEDDLRPFDADQFVEALFAEGEDGD
jgi:fused signal recognition particle receptor